MITYAIVAALILTGMVSLPITRYIADKIYLSKDEDILPSLFGCLSILVPVGSNLYLLFLIGSKLSLSLVFANITLFAELVSIFMVTNYLSAIRDYRGIFLSYLLAIITALIITLILVQFFSTVSFYLSCRN